MDNCAVVRQAAMTVPGKLESAGLAVAEQEAQP